MSKTPSPFLTNPKSKKFNLLPNHWGLVASNLVPIGNSISWNDEKDGGWSFGGEYRGLEISVEDFKILVG